MHPPEALLFPNHTWETSTSWVWQLLGLWSVRSTILTAVLPTDPKTIGGLTSSSQKRGRFICRQRTGLWPPQCYHYTRNDYRTELYNFGIIFGNSCSVIFWNYVVSVRGVSRGLPNPYRIVLGILLGNLSGGIAEPKLFWNSFGNHFVCNGKGRKNNKLNFSWSTFLACLGPPFWHKNPPEKVDVGPFFCVLSQEMRHMNFFSGGPKSGVWVRGKKFMLKKLTQCFSVPYLWIRSGGRGKQATLQKSRGPYWGL